MDNSLKVPHLNTSYVASLGTVAIGQLQQVLVYLCKGIDTKALEQKLSDKQPVSEQEQSALYLTGILKAIYTNAETTKQVTYKDLDISGLSNSLSSSV